MSRYTKRFIEEVQNQDIIEMASKYFKLQKKGSDYVTSCTHGSDSTPSLTFYRESNSFYCFGCRAGSNAVTGGSDIISFVKWMEEVEFPEAVRRIAAHFNLEEEIEEAEKNPQKERMLHERIEENREYWKHLQNSEAILSYLEGRGIGKREIDKWRLGFSPSDSSTYPSRIVFPILNEYGNTVAFSYRKTSDIFSEPQEDSPKYINSPASPIFDKGKILYGYNFIKENAKKRDYLIVGEGYTDAILAQKLNLPFISLMGTGINKYHAKMIASAVSNVILWMDGDAAGKQAAKGAARMLQDEGLTVMNIDFDGRDPHDILIEIERLESNDNAKYQAARDIIKEHAILYSHHLVNGVLSKYESRMIEIQTQALKEIETIVEDIRSPQEQAFINQMVSRRMNIRMDAD